MRTAIPSVTVACVLTIALGGCATHNDPHQRAKIGAAVGAVAGAVLGHQLDDDSGRWVGAAVDALVARRYLFLGAVLGLSVGYVVKYNLDRRFVFTDSRLEPVT